jgi:hypothetical protein
MSYDTRTIAEVWQQTYAPTPPVQMGKESDASTTPWPLSVSLFGPKDTYTELRWQKVEVAPFLHNTAPSASRLPDSHHIFVR